MYYVVLIDTVLKIAEMYCNYWASGHFVGLLVFVARATDDQSGLGRALKQPILHIYIFVQIQIPGFVLEAPMVHPVHETSIAPYPNVEIALYHLVEKFRGRQFKRRKYTYFLLYIIKLPLELSQRHQRLW